jgi:hypothetical protein
MLFQIIKKIIVTHTGSYKNEEFDSSIGTGIFKNMFFLELNYSCTEKPKNSYKKISRQEKNVSNNVLN